MNWRESIFNGHSKVRAVNTNRAHRLLCTCGCLDRTPFPPRSFLGTGLRGGTRDPRQNQLRSRLLGPVQSAELHRLLVQLLPDVLYLPDHDARDRNYVSRDARCDVSDYRKTSFFFFFSKYRFTRIKCTKK